MRKAKLPETPSLLAPILRPLHNFLSAESAGGIVLMLFAVVAIAWANSPWGDTYDHFWHTPLSVGFGGRLFAMSLQHWVNDGLMVIFFLLVGLEIKREMLVGELASMRKAALPIAAAIGGMVVPALIYFSLNRSGPTAAGWGVPMATDIAFAVGVVALVGRHLPTSAKVFLLAVAIVDDLGAVLVIAFFYTHGISLFALAIAGAFLVGLIALNLLRVHHPLPYMILGVGLWIATLASGVHATIAGVLLAFCIPASRHIKEQHYVDFMQQTLDNFSRDALAVPDRLTPDQSDAINSIESATQAVQTPLSRIEHMLLKPVNFLIVPVFAIANAGVNVRTGGSGAFTDPVTWGVLLGLLVGKPVGIMLSCWIAMKTNFASLPEGTSHRQVFGIACLCGIGFTMSLFVANLAFPSHPEHLVATKLGILVASLAAGVTGAAIIFGAPQKASELSRQSGGSGDQ